MENNWTSFLNNLNQDGKNIFTHIVENFFVPDKIDFKKWFANYMIISEGSREIYKTSITLSSEIDLSYHGTKTIDSLASPLDRPIGYEKWFIAGYPDVVKWITSIADNTEKPELTFPELNEDSIDIHGTIKTGLLRKFIDSYKSKGFVLECVE